MRAAAALLLAALCGLAAIPARADIAPKDIASLESAGTLRDIAAGAYEHTLWNGNKRGDIVAALNALPPESALRSLHDMKRRVLLSVSDAARIKNDIAITPDNNLFILRLKKLQEMGLFEDALRLYTDTIDTPRDARLAETGLTLMIHQRGLATACLEEKVLAPQFAGDEFFAMIDAVCSFELGQADEPPGIEQSPIIASVLADETRKYAAGDPAGLSAMTPLELAIVTSRGRIDYAVLDTTPAALRRYPARVLASFLADRTLPQARVAPIQTEMARRGYVPARRLPAAKDAKQLSVDVNALRKENKNAEADALFWQAFQPLLAREPEIVALTAYGPLLKDADPQTLPADQLRKAVAVLLASGQELPAAWCERFAAHGGADAPLVHIALRFVGACARNADKTVDKPEALLARFPAESHGKLWVLLGLLAPKGPEGAEFLSVYEKHFPLTLPDDYVMPIEAGTRQSGGLSGFQGFGLPLLHVLGAVKGQAGDVLNRDGLQMTLKGLLDGGLDADARQIAREVLVGILLTK